jgi:hypothetical protein
MAEDITGSRIDAVAVFLEAVQRQYMGTDCYLVRPERILESMTGTKWTASKESKDYRPAAGEREVLRYERQTVGNLVGHFVLPYYDPLGKSETVASGQLVSKRIFRPV